MDYAALPTRFETPFGQDADPANIRVVPVAPSGTPGAASMELGFPPDCFTPPSAGGVPPFGQDFNGLLKQATEWTRWQGAGGQVKYDSGFSTSIGGYPKGAILWSEVYSCYFSSLVENNTDDPDSLTDQWKAITPIQGVVTAAATGVPQAIFTWVYSTGSCYLVTATYGPSAQSVVGFLFAYSGAATIVWQSTTGTNIVLSATNPSLYVTQSSGSSQNIRWSILPLGVSP